MQAATAPNTGSLQCPKSSHHLHLAVARSHIMSGLSFIAFHGRMQDFSSCVLGKLTVEPLYLPVDEHAGLCLPLQVH